MGAVAAILSVFILALVIVIAICVSNLREAMMGQFEDLRAAVAQLGVDLGEAVSRVEAKIAAGGDPDPDLTADIAAIRDASTKLDALAADPVPEPEPGDGGEDTGEADQPLGASRPPGQQPGQGPGKGDKKGGSSWY